MVSGTSNRDVMRAVYEGYGRGDLAPFFAAMAKDGQFGFGARREDIGFAGMWTGHKKIENSLALIGKHFEWVKFECRELIAEGDRVVGLTGGKVKDRVTGRVIDFDMVDVIRFEDGKIVEFVEYFDSALLRDVLVEASKVESVRGKTAPKAKKKPTPKPAAKPARGKAKAKK